MRRWWRDFGFVYEKSKFFVLLLFFVLQIHKSLGDDSINATSFINDSKINQNVNIQANASASAEAESFAKARIRGKKLKSGHSVAENFNGEDENSNGSSSFSNNNSEKNLYSEQTVHEIQKQHVVSGGYVLLTKYGTFKPSTSNGEGNLESYTEPKKCNPLLQGNRRFDDACPTNSFCYQGLCKCLNGYGWNGIFCEDINECDFEINPCKNNILTKRDKSSNNFEEIWCINTLGSFYCCSKEAECNLFVQNEENKRINYHNKTLSFQFGTSSEREKKNAISTSNGKEELGLEISIPKDELLKNKETIDQIPKSFEYHLQIQKPINFEVQEIERFLETNKTSNEYTAVSGTDYTKLQEAFAISTTEPSTSNENLVGLEIGPDGTNDQNHVRGEQHIGLEIGKISLTSGLPITTEKTLSETSSLEINGLGQTKKPNKLIIEEEGLEINGKGLQNTKVNGFRQRLENGGELVGNGVNGGSTTTEIGLEISGKNINKATESPIHLIDESEKSDNIHNEEWERIKALQTTTTVLDSSKSTTPGVGLEIIGAEVVRQNIISTTKSIITDEEEPSEEAGKEHKISQSSTRNINLETTTSNFGSSSSLETNNLITSTPIDVSSSISTFNTETTTIAQASSTKITESSQPVTDEAEKQTSSTSASTKKNIPEEAVEIENTTNLMSTNNHLISSTIKKENSVKLESTPNPNLSTKPTMENDLTTTKNFVNQLNTTITDFSSTASYKSFGTSLYTTISSTQTPFNSVASTSTIISNFTGNLSSLSTNSTMEPFIKITSTEQLSSSTTLKPESKFTSIGSIDISPLITSTTFSTLTTKLNENQKISQTYSTIKTSNTAVNSLFTTQKSLFTSTPNELLSSKFSSTTNSLLTKIIENQATTSGQITTEVLFTDNKKPLANTEPSLKFNTSLTTLFPDIDTSQQTTIIVNTTKNANQQTPEILTEQTQQSNPITRKLNIGTTSPTPTIESEENFSSSVTLKSQNIPTASTDIASTSSKLHTETSSLETNLSQLTTTTSSSKSLKNQFVSSTTENFHLQTNTQKSLSPDILTTFQNPSTNTPQNKSSQTIKNITKKLIPTNSTLQTQSFETNPPQFTTTQESLLETSSRTLKNQIVSSTTESSQVDTSSLKSPDLEFSTSSQNPGNLNTTVPFKSNKNKATTLLPTAATTSKENIDISSTKATSLQNKSTLEIETSKSFSVNKKTIEQYLSTLFVPTTKSSNEILIEFPTKTTNNQPQLTTKIEVFTHSTIPLSSNGTENTKNPLTAQTPEPFSNVKTTQQIPISNTASSVFNNSTLNVSKSIGFTPPSKTSTSTNTKESSVNIQNLSTTAGNTDNLLNSTVIITSTSSPLTTFRQVISHRITSFVEQTTNVPSAKFVTFPTKSPNSSIKLDQSSIVPFINSTRPFVSSTRAFETSTQINGTRTKTPGNSTDLPQSSVKYLDSTTQIFTTSTSPLDSTTESSETSEISKNIFETSVKPSEASTKTSDSLTKLQQYSTESFQSSTQTFKISTKPLDSTTEFAVKTTKNKGDGGAIILVDSGEKVESLSPDESVKVKSSSTSTSEISTKKVTEMSGITNVLTTKIGKSFETFSLSTEMPTLKTSTLSTTTATFNSVNTPQASSTRYIPQYPRTLPNSITKNWEKPENSIFRTTSTFNKNLSETTTKPNLIFPKTLPQQPFEETTLKSTILTPLYSEIPSSINPTLLTTNFKESQTTHKNLENQIITSTTSEYFSTTNSIKPQNQTNISTTSKATLQTSETTKQFEYESTKMYTTETTPHSIQSSSLLPVDKPRILQSTEKTIELSTFFGTSNKEIANLTTLKLEATEKTSTKIPIQTMQFELTPSKPVQVKNRCISGDECGTDAYCERSSGVCRCAPGFYGIPPQIPCKDIDECEQKIDRCHSSSNCWNYVGGYACHCPIGYRRRVTDGFCEGLNY